MTSIKHLKAIIKAIILEGKLEKQTYTIEQLVEWLGSHVLIFFDTETTGMSSKNPYSLITEIAAVAVDMNTGENLGVYSMKSKLTPAVEKQIAKEREKIAAGTFVSKAPHLSIDDILKMTAYEGGDVPIEEEGKLLQGFKEFISQFESRNPVLVAHNAKFDMRQINDALKLRHRMDFIPKYPVVDTVTLTTKYLQPLLAGLEDMRATNPDIDNLLIKLRDEHGRWVSRLGHLGTAFDVSTKHWHSAVADAEQLGGITSSIVKFFKTYGGEKLQLGRDIMTGKAKRLPSGEIAYKKTRQRKGAVKPAVNQP